MRPIKLAKIISLFTFFLMNTYGLLALADAHSEQLDYVDEPQSCFSKKQYPCSLRTLKTTKISYQNATFHAQAKSDLLFVNADGEFKVLNGSWYVVVSADSKKEMKLTYHDMSFAFHGKLFVELVDDKLSLSNVEGTTQFAGMGLFKEEFLPEGSANWYSKILGNGEVSRGVVAPLDYMKTIKALSRMGLNSEIPVVLKNQKRAVTSLSNYYQESVSETQALTDQQKAQEARKRAAHRAEQQKIRNLFKQKNSISE